jgi:hypothetical protein
MFIPDPEFWIPDPKTATKEKKTCPTFFWSHKYKKNNNYFIFEQMKKIRWASLQKIIELFTKKCH